MKIVIPGGTGQVGSILTRAFVRDGHEVVVLSRRAVPGTGWRVVAWDARSPGGWTSEIDGADAVVNLTGRSVNCRYTRANRREIKESRVDSTNAIGAAIARAASPPRVWLQASTATIYAHRYDAPNDERNGTLGGDEPGAPASWRFSIDVAKAWEHACESAGPMPHTRRVLLRSAMTMSPDSGGIFDVLLKLVRFGLGGRAGDGRQFVSWIHEVDFVRAVYWLIENDLRGAVNLCAPHPLPYADFIGAIREAWGIRIGLSATRWMLELGTFLMRTETELVLKSRRVVPGRLLEHGFSFQFPSWPKAAEDLCRRWRGRR